MSRATGILSFLAAAILLFAPAFASDQNDSSADANIAIDSNASALDANSLPAQDANAIIGPDLNALQGSDANVSLDTNLAISGHIDANSQGDGNAAARDANTSAIVQPDSNSGSGQESTDTNIGTPQDLNASGGLDLNVAATDANASGDSNSLLDLVKKVIDKAIKAVKGLVEPIFRGIGPTPLIERQVEIEGKQARCFGSKCGQFAGVDSLREAGSGKVDVQAAQADANTIIDANSAADSNNSIDINSGAAGDLNSTDGNSAAVVPQDGNAMHDLNATAADADITADLNAAAQPVDVNGNAADANSLDADTNGTAVRKP